ncbi:unnamed protein product [Schistocephalus solidus]|uniref:Glutathione transferase n=1 Tax=Schistocephalus solidus TaxID=70667 RepID=A0A183T3J1_SCHSO|nr:unnamed protein product [Schistocephalus solidus]
MGDPEPSINPEKFTLFDLQFCPFCQRVRYTLDYHEIPYDRVLVNPISKPSWYLRLNPSGKVPLLLYKGEKLVESDLIMQFVDQFKGSDVSLLSIAVPRYKLCYSSEATEADADALKAALSNLNKTIKGPYLFGEKLSLADLAVFPFLNAWDLVMNRVLKMENASGDSVEAVASQWPNVLKYRQLMNQKPYIMKTAFQDDVYAKFVDAYVLKKADADF